MISTSKPRISQFMPAPGWWALFYDSDLKGVNDVEGKTQEINYAFPLVGWALVDAENVGDQVRPLITAPEGVELADTGSNYIGTGYFPNGLPPGMLGRNVVSGSNFLTL